MTHASPMHPGGIWPVALALLTLAPAARAQSEAITQPVGMDTQLVFAHTSIPGATGIDFSLTCGISPLYPEAESHTIIIVFEWGPTATGPWTSSPDHVNTVPGGITDFFSTGVYHAPEDAPFVALHMYAGGLMIVSGTFTHTSVPAPGAITVAGVAALGASRRRRGPIP